LPKWGKREKKKNVPEKKKPDHGVRRKNKFAKQGRGKSQEGETRSFKKKKKEGISQTPDTR